MPVTNPALASLPEDPGMEASERPRRSRTTPTSVSRADKRAAVDSVLALMGRAPARPGAPATHTAAVLPSSRVRSALEGLIAYGTVENLTAAQPDLKTLARDLFDWGIGSGPTRATKSMARAIGQILTARNEAGISLYPQGVEMLSFAAAVSPLLEPDRLQRLIETAPSVSTAFAPERYTMQLAAAAKTVFSRYPEQRREQLLISMWEQAHTGRWWNITSGIVEMRTGPGRRGNGDDVEAERRIANAQMLRELLAGARVGTEAAHRAVRESLLDGTLAYHPETRPLVSALPVDEGLRTFVSTTALALSRGEAIDPDLAVHASAISWLLPGERPETPLTWLLRTLLSALITEQGAKPDVAALPDKPKQFAELYPAADLVGFPFPDAIKALHRTPLRGMAQNRHVLIELVHNASELAENATYMGNCTLSYKSQQQSGRYVLFRLWDGDACINAAATSDGGRWTLREIQSRFNGRGVNPVPVDIRDAFVAMIGTFPPPLTVQDLPAEERVLRRQRYAIA